MDNTLKSDAQSIAARRNRLSARATRLRAVIRAMERELEDIIEATPCRAQCLKSDGRALTALTIAHDCLITIQCHMHG